MACGAIGMPASPGDKRGADAVKRVRVAGIVLILALSASCGQEQTRTQAATAVAEPPGEVELWRQFQAEYVNTSWRGNPFDLEFTGEFTHVETGRMLKQFGFYAGGDRWKIHFMPDRVGEWMFTTRSTDRDLDGYAGSFTALPSDLPGMLETDGIRWRLSAYGPIMPILLAAGPFVRTDPIAQTQSFVDWARDTAGARIIGTTLLHFDGDSPRTLSQADRMYEDDAEGERFHLPAWDRMDEFHDALRDRGMGQYILIYGDDESAPEWRGLPEGRRGSIGRAEQRLFRYLVARFGAYPIVMWDSGIDIGEYRSPGWIENFAEWFRANDPWQHPVASRTGSGSGGVHPQSATYYSDGERTLPSRSELLEKVTSRTVPTAMTDRYRENYPSPFNGGRAEVRRAAWQMLLSYGTAVYISGNEHEGYLGRDYASDLEAAPDLGRVTRFAEQHLVNAGALSPADELVLSAEGEVMVARAGGEEYVACVFSGRTLTVDLAGSSGALNVAWYDPLGGEHVMAGTVTGGTSIEFTIPGSNAGETTEWVLHLSAVEPGGSSASDPQSR
jgi:hypothetical protein